MRFSTASISTSKNILANAAGITAEQTLCGHPDGLWERVVAVNLHGSYRTIRRCLPGMIERGRGHLVLLGSTAGLHALPTTVYGASKGAIHMMTANLRLDLSVTGVRVTEVCPGLVTTEFYDAAIDDCGDSV